MNAFRIVKTKYATALKEVFDGQGAKKYGGRWNSVGLPCVYLATSESLALLEMVVHLNTSSLTPAYSLFQLEIAEKYVMNLADNNLPSDWKEDPAPPSTAQIGDQWLSSKISAVLSVPSVIVPRERNYILNVSHPDSAKIVNTAIALPITLDHRLL